MNVLSEREIRAVATGPGQQAVAAPSARAPSQGRSGLAPFPHGAVTCSPPEAFHQRCRRRRPLLPPRCEGTPEAGEGRREASASPPPPPTPAGGNRPFPSESRCRPPLPSRPCPPAASTCHGRRSAEVGIPPASGTEGGRLRLRGGAGRLGPAGKAKWRAGGGTLLRAASRR